MALYPINSGIPANIDPTPSGTTTIATTIIAITATLLLSANANRKGFTIYNNSSRTLYLGTANTVTTSSNFFAIIPANTLYEWNVQSSYTGPLFAIAVGGNANVQVMELTP